LGDEASHCEQIEGDQSVRKFAFKFIIPRILLPCDTIFTEQFLQLPPSLKAGESHRNRHGQTCMQPLISYAIRAVLELRGPVAGLLRELQDTRNILLIPFTGPSPPLAIDDFPGEYVVESKTLLTKIPYRNSFGEMSISMNEPSALVFTGGTPNATTLGYMNLILKPVNGVGSSNAPEPLKCTIYSQIHVKIFYSTMPLRGMPTYSMLKGKSGLRVQSRYINLQTRKIRAHSWRPDERPKPGGNREIKDSWTTILVLPICGSSRLLPTFCSTLAALRYALRVRVNIGGFHHSPIALEIPLQVLSCSDVRNVRGNSISENNFDDRNVQDAVGLQGSGNFDTFQVSLPNRTDFHFTKRHHSILIMIHLRRLMIKTKMYGLYERCRR
jgi:hypothetical protein